MKNKALTYVLGILVIAVWGTILFRVFGAFSGDNNDIPVIANTFKKESFDDYTVPKDTTKLLLNYRDPFGIEKPDTDEVISKKEGRRTAVQIQSPKIQTNWGFIKYSGYIRNPNTKKLLAMVSINGKESMMSEGETSDQVKLLKNLKDSIKISYQGNTTVITMNKTP